MPCSLAMHFGKFIIVPCLYKFFSAAHSDGFRHSVGKAACVLGKLDDLIHIDKDSSADQKEVFVYLQLLLHIRKRPLCLICPSAATDDLHIVSGGPYSKDITQRKTDLYSPGNKSHLLRLFRKHLKSIFKAGPEPFSVNWLFYIIESMYGKSIPHVLAAGRQKNEPGMKELMNSSPLEYSSV